MFIAHYPRQYNMAKRLDTVQSQSSELMALFKLQFQICTVHE